jgi:N-acetylglutamate synthase-like GNAT family acetyltransferase
MTITQLQLFTPSGQTNQIFIYHVVNLVNEAYSKTQFHLHISEAEVQACQISKTCYIAFESDLTYLINLGVADIRVLTVHHDARGLGLRLRLIAHTEAEAIGQDAKTVWL